MKLKPRKDHKVPDPGLHIYDRECARCGKPIRFDPKTARFVHSRKRAG